VAYVNPPQRPGATLWSLAAGPLVNVVLLPLLIAAVMMGRSLGWAHAMPDAYHLLRMILWIDVSLLVFNMLPIYPLDGGQILRSLLWFVIGRARSLMAVTVLGLLGIIAFAGLALWLRSFWLGAICVFMLLNCWGGLRRAQAMLRFEKLPRRKEFACPSCRMSPPLGAYWKCGNCGQLFDTFQTGAVCPGCAAHYASTMCLSCQQRHPINDWIADAYPRMGIISGTIAAK
jgi:hypothetical protein